MIKILHQWYTQSSPIKMNKFKSKKLEIKKLKKKKAHQRMKVVSEESLGCRMKNSQANRNLHCFSWVYEMD